MFLTKAALPYVVVLYGQGRNPLKSGQCFLQGRIKDFKAVIEAEDTSRNPLKSGQCFLHSDIPKLG